MFPGIGRTGTFCTLDIAIRKFAATEKIDIRSTGTCIRSKGGYRYTAVSGQQVRVSGQKVRTDTLLYPVSGHVYPVKRYVPIYYCVRSTGTVHVSSCNILLYPVNIFLYPVKKIITNPYLVGQYVPIHCCIRCTATCIRRTATFIRRKKYNRNDWLFLRVYVSGWKIPTDTCCIPSTGTGTVRVPSRKVPLDSSMHSTGGTGVLQI